MLSKKRWLKMALLIAVVVVSGLFPVYYNQPYYLQLLTLVFINIILAVSLRLTLVTGQFNVAHPAMMALGAYGGAILAKSFGVPPALTLLCGGLISASVSLVLGMPILRLRGIYFALVTIAFIEVVRIGLSHGGAFTGSLLGLMDIPSLSIAGSTINSRAEFYWFGFALMVLTVVILYRIEVSRVGLTWKAISQSEEMAAAQGVNVMMYKTAAFVIGSFFAGMAGAFYAYFQRFLVPTTFDFNMAVNILVYNFVGGTSTIVGPILGASFMTLISEPFKGLTYYETIFFGVVLMAVIIFLPGGIITITEKFKFRKKTVYADEEQ